MTTVNVTQIARETLETRDPKARIAQIHREILYAGDPKVRVTQFFREVLHSRPTGQLQCLTCDLAELYFNPGTFLDFTNPANRALFHDADMRPIPIGTDGSIPTGSAPMLYLTVQTFSLTPDPYDFPTNASGNGALAVISIDNHGRGYGLAQPPSPTD